VLAGVAHVVHLLGDDLVSVSYEEPARDLLPVPAPGTTKKFVAGA
jgi:hypothetical protein